MYLVFLSESGQTGLSADDPSQPHHVHAGLLVQESQYISMTGEYDALVRRHFGAPAGSDGVPNELRPGDLYQGTGYFRSWRPDRRAELIQDCLSILIRREIPLLVSSIDKAKFLTASKTEGNSIYGNTDPSRLAFSRFLLALAMFLDENVMSQMNPDDIMQSSWSVNDYAMLMAGAESQSISLALTDFLSEENDSVNPSMYDDLMIAPAATSVGGQLASLCVYVIRRWLQQPDATHGYFDALRDGRVLQVVYPYQFD
ncbi:hypothetical protein GBAR_LOCUS8636 [Geodia barretti]|uniref:DUF3800 domain-containing protein n=1 Tax=Geodia barretti TaxID=519541 RepID=A0AA35RMW5_GEOBA|nr:hypothetical protein GBAR_LOCUS8636 [Geodia barretti]